MGWFKKKSDPISERSQALNQQIARLEAQIRELSEQQATAAREEPKPEPAPGRPAPVRPPPPPAEPAPRLRSTALPQGHKSAPEPKAESGLEELSSNPFKGKAERPSQPQRDLGVNQSDFTSLWKRFKRQFRAPATSNPRLVSYLAAGSIQGLRPLRYEKRVARNRTILLLVCLVLILWGILAIVIR